MSSSTAVTPGKVVSQHLSYWAISHFLYHPQRVAPWPHNLCWHGSKLSTHFPERSGALPIRPEIMTLGGHLVMKEETHRLRGLISLTSAHPEAPPLQWGRVRPKTGICSSCVYRGTKFTTKVLNQQKTSQELTCDPAGTPEPQGKRQVLDFTDTGLGPWGRAVSVPTQGATTGKFIIAHTKDSRDAVRDPKARVQHFAIDMVLWIQQELRARDVEKWPLWSRLQGHARNRAIESSSTSFGLSADSGKV